LHVLLGQPFRRIEWVGAFGDDHLELEGAMSRGKVRKDLYTDWTSSR
jgi:hypothetical protein